MKKLLLLLAVMEFAFGLQAQKTQNILFYTNQPIDSTVTRGYRDGSPLQGVKVFPDRSSTYIVSNAKGIAPITLLKSVNAYSLSDVRHDAFELSGKENVLGRNHPYNSQTALKLIMVPNKEIDYLVKVLEKELEKERSLYEQALQYNAISQEKYEDRKRALAKREQELRKDAIGILGKDLSRLDSLNLKAHILMRQGRFEEAIAIAPNIYSLFSKTDSIEQTLNRLFQTTLAGIDNKITIYYDEESYDSLIVALNRKAELLHDVNDTAAFINLFELRSEAYRQKLMFDKALADMDSVLTLKKRHFGAKDERLIVSWQRKAELYEERGDIYHTMTCLENLLTLVKKHVGEVSLDAAGIYGRLAELNKRAGNIKEAKEYSRKVKKIYKELEN